jgi:hypothetical protein
MICPPDLQSLGAAERAAHVAECEACRLELDLATAPPDAPCDDARVARLVDGALSDFMRAPVRRSRPTRLNKWALLAAAVLLVGAAAAANLLRTPRQSVVDQAPVAPKASATTVAQTAAPETVAPSIVSVEDLPSAQPPPPPTPIDDVTTSASLFASANAARRHGAHAVAISQYRLLERRFPASEEAATAHVSLALLLLDQAGDAQGALAEVDRYLADQPHGSLREESLTTRARALGKLGRRDEEKQAWSNLLREYPDSLYRDTARSRMGD